MDWNFTYVNAPSTGVGAPLHPTLVKFVMLASIEMKPCSQEALSFRKLCSRFFFMWIGLKSVPLVYRLLPAPFVKNV